MELWVYRWATWLLGPFIYLYLLKRKIQGKEDPKRLSERFGKAKLPRPKGALLWVHAASVGEALSVLPLLHRIGRTYPLLSLLITTGTVSSAKVLEQKLGKRMMHHYVPVDNITAVQRFLNHWQPNLAFFVESELWPNLVIETHHTGCPMVAINARFSKASATTWQRFPGLIKRMFACFSLMLAQSEEDAGRLLSMGASNVQYIGNLKLDAPALLAHPKELATLLMAIGERPLWFAASTHPGEEAIIARAHEILQQTFPDILTVIAPRHPTRAKEIKEQLQKDYPVTVALRSQGQNIEQTTDIYLADTLGELGVFYRLAGIVFMGGSLVPKGGQNPLEAARLECALVAGPYVENFQSIYSELAQEKALLSVTSAETLARAIEQLLQDHRLQEMLANRAFDWVESKRGVVEAYIKALTPFVEPLTEAKELAHEAA